MEEVGDGVAVEDADDQHGVDGARGTMNLIPVLGLS